MDLLLALLIPIIITIIVMGVLEPRTTRWAEKHIDQDLRGQGYYLLRTKWVRLSYVSNDFKYWSPSSRKEQILNGLNSRFRHERQHTIRQIDQHTDINPVILQRLAKLAVSDPDSQVRQLAHDFIANYEGNSRMQQVDNL